MLVNNAASNTIGAITAKRCLDQLQWWSQDQRPGLTQQCHFGQLPGGDRIHGHRQRQLRAGQLHRCGHQWQVVRDGLGNSVGVLINNAGNFVDSSPARGRHHLYRADDRWRGARFGQHHRAEPFAGRNPAVSQPPIGVEILGPQDPRVQAENYVQGNLIGIDGREHAAADTIGVYINNSRATSSAGMELQHGISSRQQCRRNRDLRTPSQANLVEGNYRPTSPVTAGPASPVPTR